MRSSRRRALASFAVGVLALALGAWLALAARAPDAPATAPDASVLRLRVGEVHVYRSATGGAEMEVLAPVRARAADLLWVDALPLVFRVEGRSGGTASLVDLARGGLVAAVDACHVLPSEPCLNGPDEAFVAWQACPLNGVFAPLDVVPARALDAPRLALEDPLKSTTWTYAVAREGRDAVRLTLEGASEARASCGPAEGFLVDLARGRVTELRNGGVTFTLARVEGGSGAPLRLGGGPPPAARLVAPDAPRRGPFPPGAETLGPAAWTLGAAWEHAQADSALAAFLAGGEAFAYSAANSTSEATLALGLVTLREHLWRFTLVRADGAALDVEALLRETPAGPVKETRATEAPAPPDVPRGFRAPAERAASLTRVAEALAAAGVPLAGHAQLRLVFDVADADFAYHFPVGEGASAAGAGRVVADFALVNADTGRLEQLDVAEGEMARYVAARPAGT